MTIFSKGKILNHIERIADWKTTGESFPIQIELGTTNLCNNKCPACCGYENRESHKVELDKAAVLKLIDEAAECGVKSITFTGDGEPTCHRNWLDFIKHTKKRGMQAALITNGVKNFDAAIPYCEWIRVSVDASTPETYKKTHGVPPSIFQRVLSNINSACKKKIDGKCTIGVGFLTCRETHHEILDFAKLMWNYDVDYIQYRPMLSVFGSDWFSDTHETVDLIKKAQEINPRVTFSDAKYKGLIEGHYGQTDKCYGWIFETAVSADGGIYRCCHYKGIRSQRIGDIKKGFWAEWQRIKKDPFTVLHTCPKFCRHYSNNRPMEELMKPREHGNFI